MTKNKLTDRTLDRAKYFGSSGLEAGNTFSIEPLLHMMSSPTIRSYSEDLYRAGLRASPTNHTQIVIPLPPLFDPPVLDVLRYNQRTNCIL